MKIAAVLLLAASINAHATVLVVAFRPSTGEVVGHTHCEDEACNPWSASAGISVLVVRDTALPADWRDGALYRYRVTNGALQRRTDADVSSSKASAARSSSASELSMAKARLVAAQAELDLAVAAVPPDTVAVDVLTKERDRMAALCASIRKAVASK